MFWGLDNASLWNAKHLLGKGLGGWGWAQKPISISPFQYLYEGKDATQNETRAKKCSFQAPLVKQAGQLTMNICVYKYMLVFHLTQKKLFQVSIQSYL